MNYNLELNIEELNLLKSVLIDYKQKLEQNILSAQFLASQHKDDKAYESLILSNKNRINEVILLMGKLYNIIPDAKKITKED